jgi:hypothetical protein
LGDKTAQRVAEHVNGGEPERGSEAPRVLGHLPHVIWRAATGLSHSVLSKTARDGLWPVRSLAGSQESIVADKVL